MNSEEQHILQKHLSRFLIDEVFNTISTQDILSIKGKRWFLKGRELNEAEIKNLKDEAQIIQSTQLWKIISTQLDYLAQQKLVDSAKTEQDLIASRVMMYIKKEIIKLLQNVLK